MTTIAYDGNILAADSLVIGDYSSDDHNKIQRVGNNHYCACAGDYMAGVAFCIWLKDGGEKPSFGKDDFEAIEIHPDKGLIYWDSYLVRAEAKYPIAIGSGSAHAITAMDIGKTAIEAVEYAILRDSSTGGKVNHVRVKGE